MDRKYDTGVLCIGDSEVTVLGCTFLGKNTKGQAGVKIHLEAYHNGKIQKIERVGTIMGNTTRIKIYGEPVMVGLNNGYLFPVE